MTHLAKSIVDSQPFRVIIIAVILLAGVLAGVETSAAMLAQHGPLLTRLLAGSGMSSGDIITLVTPPDLPRAAFMTH